MTDTIMQDTVTQDADMQNTDMEDTVMQDTDMQDATTQDTDMPGVARKIAKMKTPRKDGKKTLIRKNLWGPTENFHLLHLYTVNDNNISRDKGNFHYRTGVVASLARDMTAESVKHHPGGLLHASDPWFPRVYARGMIRYKLRCLLNEEDDLAAELEAELNAHYGIDSDFTAQQPAIERQIRALEQQSRRAEEKLEKELKQQREILEKELAKESAKELKKQKAILRQKKIREEKRVAREKELQDTN